MNYDATDTEKPYSCESEIFFLSPPQSNSLDKSVIYVHFILTLLLSFVSFVSLPIRPCLFSSMQLVVHVTRLVPVWLITTLTRTRTCSKAALAMTKTLVRPHRRLHQAAALAWSLLPPHRSIPCTASRAWCPPITLKPRQVGNRSQTSFPRTSNLSFYKFFEFFLFFLL